MIHVRRWRRIAPLAAGMAALLTVAVGPVLAQPASALVPCTSTSVFVHGTVHFSIPTDKGSTNCMLAKGNNSAAVKSLQSDLNLCYSTTTSLPGSIKSFSPKLTVDGDFGTKTMAALKAAQSNYAGIAHDGVYGPQTRKTIVFPVDDGSLRCERFGA
jgi:hypothetical protein